MSPGGGHAVVTGGLDALESTAVATGVTSPLGWPVPSDSSRLYPFVARAGGFVVVENSMRGPYEPQIGVAYFVDERLSTAIPLGPASAVVASTEPDRVWLVTDDATPDQRLHGGVVFGQNRTVTEVDTQGRVTVPVRVLTDDRTVIGAVQGGLLTVRTDGGSSVAEVWDPAAGRATTAAVQAGFPIGASGPTFADQPAGCSAACPVRIHDLQDGRETDLPPPAGRQWDAAALSPDGRQLAVLAVGPPDPASLVNGSFLNPARSVPGTVFVYGADDLRLASQHDVTSWTGGPGLAWSPDGQWVFLAAAPDKVAYLPAGDGRAAVGNVTVPSAQDFVVLPAA